MWDMLLFVSKQIALEAVRRECLVNRAGVVSGHPPKAIFFYQAGGFSDG